VECWSPLTALILRYGGLFADTSVVITVYVLTRNRLSFGLLATTFFVDASSSTSIETDLRLISQAKKLDSTAQAALTWLRGQSQRPWLIIFNNADDPELLLRDYLPQCSHANILIASRNHSLQEDLADDAY
jgi:hypothetical protein